MRRWIKAVAQPFVLCAGLVAAGLLLRGVGFDDAIRRAGEEGPGALILVGSLACALGVPRQLVAYTGGLAYGFWPGAVVALVAEMVGMRDRFLVGAIAGPALGASLVGGASAARPTGSLPTGQCVHGDA